MTQSLCLAGSVLVTSSLSWSWLCFQAWLCWLSGKAESHFCYQVQTPLPWKSSPSLQS